MARFTAIITSCAVLLMTGPAVLAADRGPGVLELFSSGGCRGDTDYDLAACIQARLNRTARCVGSTVEERLECLERRMAAQESEIWRLRRELDHVTSPRVHPLATLAPQSGD